MLIKIALLLLITAELSLSQKIDSLSYYEKQFNPSVYDIREIVFPHRLFSNMGEETISGFRVQILVTNQLDSANAVRNLVQSLLSSSIFQSQKVYIIYEPPNYKVRVGDFERLQDASLLRKFLIENGFKYAWIVNDRIRKR
ncbi:MAG: SPOR domain-containing protein [Candidatus Kryptonium sp.]|nr:SPOR domain-containing protein [Candidatus Kryptonium sp.]MCX7762254.1 SPOR domain-containing protein [Candidatus Kryptonium sp.]MDW8109331.1 SPOR domain-containing protein [Candidatus Kryptonium sp.]